MANLQAFQANTLVDSRTEASLDQSSQKIVTRKPTVSQEFADIYDKIKFAVTISILSSLARCDRYIPFTSKVYLVPGLSFQSQPMQDLESFTYMGKGATMMVIDVQWLSTGTMLISSHPDFTTHWRSMEQTYADETLTPEVGSEKLLKLAPIGLSAKYMDRDVTLSDSSPTSELRSNSEYFDRSNKAIRDWKISISRLLQCYGIELPVETRWIHARVFPPLAEAIQDGSDKDLAYTVLWPAQLSFYEVKIHDPTKRDISWALEYDNHKSVDPLADAESWFLGKASREEALKAHRQKADISAISKEDGSSSDEDSMSEIVIDTQRPIDQQALNGIYPTPPDGYRSQAFGLGHNAEHNDSKPSKVNEGRQQILDEDQLSPTSPDVDTGLGEYDRLDDEDLFGDMNTDMFTATGITEADFSFFDEPSNADDEPHLVTIPSSESQPPLSRDIVSRVSPEAELATLEDKGTAEKRPIPMITPNDAEGDRLRSGNSM